jgi:hypothetical protein
VELYLHSPICSVKAKEQLYPSEGEEDVWEVEAEFGGGR